MTLKKKILVTITSLLALAIVTFAFVISHDSACVAPPALAEGKAGMKAMVRTCYGGPDKLTLATLEKPKPLENQVLVKVRVASVNPYDWHMVTGKPYIMRMMSGIGAPDRIRVGGDFSGTVEAVGPGVEHLRVGADVFGTAGGAFGEYVLAREGGSIAKKPANLSHEEAAAIPIAAITALQGLRDQGKLVAGQKVLVNGASGGVGTYAVQIAKAMGAEVTGVCSTRNVELVRSLGAARVIDYTREDFTRRDERYDLIIDNVGNHAPLDLDDVLNPGGRVVIIGGPKDDPWIGPLIRPIQGAVLSKFMDTQFITFIANVNEADLVHVAQLASAGELRSSIERRYRLDEVAEALAHIGSRRARGKVVVNISE
jgi:NADPH:quinone reductase-like Zn-dependent oxidoreductase